MICRWNKVFIAVLAIILISSVCIMAGCSQPNDVIWEEVTVYNRLGDYSLEYPAHYKKHNLDNLGFEIPYSLLSFESPSENLTTEVFNPETAKMETVAGEPGKSFISVYISDFKAYYGDSYSATDSIDEILTDNARWENFQLLGRSPVTVSGIEGELVVYLVDKLVSTPVEDSDKIWYVRAVFFDYNGFTWEIAAISDEYIQERVNIFFNHAIETFEILE